MNGKKKLTKHTEQVNEVSQAEFARTRRVSKAMVTKWKQENRLVFTQDGKRILVNESNQRLKETASPAGFTNSIHAENRRNKDDITEPDIPLTELTKKVNELQLDLETTNAQELFNNARALREKAAALQAAAEHEKFIGSQVARDVAEKIIFERARQFRDGVIAASRRIAPDVIGKESIVEIEQIVQKELRGMLEQFAKLPVVE